MENMTPISEDDMSEAELRFRRELELRLKSLEERLFFLEQTMEVQKRDFSNA